MPEKKGTDYSDQAELKLRDLDQGVRHRLERMQRESL